MKKCLVLIFLIMLAKPASISFGAAKSTEGTSNLFSYEVTMSTPANTFLVLPDRSIGGPLESLHAREFQTRTGTLLLLLSSVEHAYFKHGKLMRYQYMPDPQKAQRASPSICLQLAAQVGQKNFMKYFDVELFAHLLNPTLPPFTLEKVDGKTLGVAYDAQTKTYTFTVGMSE